jgi:uroporphyrinogen decarboxylase
MKRAEFLRTSLIGAGTLLATRGTKAETIPPASNKRDRMLQWLEGKTEPSYTPAAFFLHFDKAHHVGAAAAEKHLEYFSYTDMDFLKIQYEQGYPSADFLKQPSDWSKLKPAPLDFFEPQLDGIRRIVKAKKKEALIIVTLYSPFMWAEDCAPDGVFYRHLEENPEQVGRGLETIVTSQLTFANACIKAGVDGFYMSTQGGESGRLPNLELFTKYIKPADLVAMKLAVEKCPFNILHVCDYVSPYASYENVIDYPGQVVNANSRLKDSELSWKEIATLFKRPIMGGLDRHGVLATGSPEAVEQEVKKVLKDIPRQFILGADCTVPSETKWENLKRAIAIAHTTGR